VAADVASLEMNANVYDLAFRSHRPLLGRFLVRAFEFFRRLLTPVLTRQSAYNAANARILAAFRAAGREDRQALEATRTDVQTLAARIAALEGTYEELRALAARERQALRGEADEARGIHVQLRDATQELRRWQTQAREVLQAADDVRVALPAVPAAVLVSPRPADAALDTLAFEERFRGSEQDVKERQRGYVEYFRGAENVLDLGCGRGEFLELLREAAIGARGIDLHPAAVAHCRGKGLDVERRDALDHLAALPDDSLGGIFAAQVIEHLEPSRVIDLVALAHRKLRPGAALLLETPNPECLAIFARSFFVDFSHVRPLHPAAMQFLLESRGFASVDVELSAPVEEGVSVAALGGDDGSTPAELRRAVASLVRLVYGHQDYAVVGRKPISGAASTP
jgi:O-antigen chain-terminating methyltransferase